MGQEKFAQTPNLIASLAIFPVGVGTSLGEYVGKAHSAIKEIEGIDLEPTAMSTIIEGRTLDKIWEAVQAAHNALLEAGAQRIYMVLTLDDRRDQPHTGKYKVARMTGAPTD